MYYDVIYIGTEDNYSKLKQSVPYAKFLNRTWKFSVDYENAQALASTEYYYLLYTHEVDFDFGRSYSEYDLEYRLRFPSYNGYDQNLLYLIKHNDIYAREKLIDLPAYKTQHPDIFYISYDEDYAESRFMALEGRLNGIRHIRGIKGIDNAHKAAAGLSATDNFFVIDADAEVINFDVFSFVPEHYWKKYVHVWKSFNPVINDSYGYGGVKLFPKDKVLNFCSPWTDFTGSVAGAFYKSHNVVSNNTCYATDDFSAWKAAFREMAKLTYVLKYNPPDDLEQRKNMVHHMKMWCNSSGHQFSESNNKGALAGRMHVINNPSLINKINDYSWLKEQYESR